MPIPLSPLPVTTSPAARAVRRGGPSWPRVGLVRVAALLVALSACGACVVPAPGAVRSGADAPADLSRWMVGTFSNQAQADAQPAEFPWVRRVVLPIWAGRPGGPWLYVEEARVESLDRPVLQQVVALREAAGVLVARTHELPGPPLFYASPWHHLELIESVQVAQLLATPDCDVIYTLYGDGFHGRTRSTRCAVRAREASWARQELVVAPDRTEAWARGYDETGLQVAGPRMGPLVFERVSHAAPLSLGR